METLHAFGIALNQAGGSLDGVWDKAMSFKLSMALAARTGIFSAELAAQGFTGTKDAFLGRHGYFKLYCRDYDTSGLTKDLGRRFYADRVIKPHSACRATHAAIDAALKIACKQDIYSDGVREIAIIVPPWIIDGFTGQPFIPAQEATPQIAGAFSLRYTIATALLRKAVKPAYFADAYLSDPAIHALIDRMKLIPLEPGNGVAAEVKVTMVDGSILSGETDFPGGDIFRTPLSDEQIRAKFRDNVDYSQTVTKDKAEQALTRLEALEEEVDVRHITSLLA
jgi:2-methylcitrate dehydratase PrpD